MATIEKNIKKGQYLKKTGADSYVHYHFDTDDSIVYLIDNLEKIQGGGEVDSSHYAKGTTLHETLSALYTLASKGGQASTDLATLKQKVNGLEAKHTSDINTVNASIATTKSDLLGTDSDTAGANTIHGANKAAKNAQDTADRAIDIANGQSRAYVFADAAKLKSGTLSNNQPIQSGYKVGDSIYIIAGDVSDFWISGFASTGTVSTDNEIQTAKKGKTIVVKWGAAYVSLTALESKRDLNDYVTTGALNSTLKNYYDSTTSDGKYVPYNGATKPVNLGNNTITVGDATVQANQISTIIAGGNITLNGLAKLPTDSPSTTVGRKVEIDVTGITVDENKTYKYPLGNSGTLATQEFVKNKGYQTEIQVDALIKRTALSFGGDVIGEGNIINQPIELRLTNMADLPTADTTFSAVKVNKQGRVTAGGQQIRFASTIDDPILKDLVIGGVAIIDA